MLCWINCLAASASRVAAQTSGCDRALTPRSRNLDLGPQTSDLGLSRLGPRASGLGPRASGLGPRASGLGLSRLGLSRLGLSGSRARLGSPRARTNLDCTSMLVCAQTNNKDMGERRYFPPGFRYGGRTCLSPRGGPARRHLSTLCGVAYGACP